MKEIFNLLAYLAWLIFSTLLLLAFVVSIDMYFAYRELRGPAVESIANKDGVRSANEKNNSTGLHSPHNDLGWILNKNIKKSHAVAGNFDVTYTINSQGFRSTPNRPFADKRIYFFGDSFTFGHGVNDNDTFASIISLTWLNDRIQVINAGTNGYGLTQMYRRFLDILGQLKSGDLVIFTPISKDLLRSFKDFAVPAEYIFTQETNSNQIQFYPYFEDGKIKRGKLDTACNRIKALLFHAPLTGKVFRKINRFILDSVDFKDASSMFELVKNQSASRKAGFHLFFLPQVKDLIRGKYKYDVERYNYLDIWSYFPSGEVANEQIGFPDDGHWNCRGHEIAAHAIVETLIDNNFLDKKYLTRSLEDIPELCTIKNQAI